MERILCRFFHSFGSLVDDSSGQLIKSQKWWWVDVRFKWKRDKYFSVACRLTRTTIILMNWHEFFREFCIEKTYRTLPWNVFFWYFTIHNPFQNTTFEWLRCFFISLLSVAASLYIATLSTTIVDWRVSRVHDVSDVIGITLNWTQWQQEGGTQTRVKMIFRVFRVLWWINNSFDFHWT